MMASETVVDELKQAINRNDLDSVKALMRREPELHSAPIGYGNDGPLTWVAECRVPWEPPSEARLAMARWMIENGSDVHQGGDGPLIRAALRDDRIPMMELLVSHGADVNATWHGSYPIIFAPCESLEALALEWLLAYGADHSVGALDYVIGTYLRSTEDLRACIDVLIKCGAKTKYDLPGVLAILRGDNAKLAQLLRDQPGLAMRQFPELDFGTTGGRMLTLRGATLLHVAAEYGNVDALNLLLDAGADVNALAAIEEGVGGQTALFHAATQFDDFGLQVVKVLLACGADPTLSARVPGDYERPGETVECDALEYALLFPGQEGKTTALLRQIRDLKKVGRGS